jgi:NAD-dependent SIR2 family protein deacetylase
MKVCSKCKEEKPLEAFSKYSRSSDGHKGYCKSCASLQSKEYHERTKVLNPRVLLYGPEDARVLKCYDDMRAMYTTRSSA